MNSISVREVIGKAITEITALVRDWFLRMTVLLLSNSQSRFLLYQVSLRRIRLCLHTRDSSCLLP